MTTSDEQTHTVCVSDILNLRDDHQYRIIKTFASSGRIVLQRTNQSTSRNFLPTHSHLSISAPEMVTQSTQIDPPCPATDDLLACDILQYCGPAAVEDYHQGCPYCMDDIHWIALPERFIIDQKLLWDTNFKKERTMTTKDHQQNKTETI